MMSTDPRFVGREDERRSFQRLLDDPYGEKRLNFIWGPGGIGKTWLVREMLQMARQNGAFQVADDVIDMYATNSRHLEGVIEAIITQLSLPKSTFAAYRKEKNTLTVARQQAGYAQTGIEANLSAVTAAFRKEMVHVVQKHPVVLAFDTFEHVQDNPVGRWLLSDEGLQMPGLLCIVAGRKCNPDDLEQFELGGLSDVEAFNFYKHYQPSLLIMGNLSQEEETYISQLNKLAEGNPLLLGLAIFWLSDAHLSEKALQSLDQAEFQRHIASWLSPAAALRPGSLFPGVPQELADPLRQTLVCMAYLNRRFNYNLLIRLIEAGYVYGANAVDLWQILTSKKVPDFFYMKMRPDKEIQLHDKLAEMLRLLVLPDASNEWATKRLPDIAHDVIRWYDDLIVQAANDQQEAILQVEKMTYAMSLDVLIDIQQPEWVGTPEADRLFELLTPDFTQVKKFLSTYQQQHNDVLDRLVVGEMQPNLVAYFPKADQYEVYSQLGEMARDAYLLKESADYWHHAFAVAQEKGSVRQQIVALRWQSNSTWQNDQKSALALLRQAEELCDEAPELRSQILYSIGFVYRQMQDLETAVIWYEKALESAKQYDSERLMTPTILNDIGYALLLIGQYDKAEARIKMAALLRERNRDKAQAKWDNIKDQLTAESDPTKLVALRQQEVKAQEAWRDATLKLGMTYNTLGQLARQNPSDLADATGYYAEALAIFTNEKINDLYWQAQAYQAKGDALRRLALDLFFKERHDSSLDYDRQAVADIETSLTYCYEYGYVDLLPLVHRRKGRLLHDRALRAAGDPKRQVDLIKDALVEFETGIIMARQSGNTLEELENSTEIAFLTDDLIRAYRQKRKGKPLTKRQREEIQAYLGQFRQVIEAHRIDTPRIYHFSVFDDLDKIEQAAFHYEMGEYDKALTYYLEGYTGLASDPGYGSARCRAHFEHLLGNIRKLPNPDMKEQWYRAFIDTWQKTPVKRSGGKMIAETHPKLIEQLELHWMFE